MGRAARVKAAKVAANPGLFRERIANRLVYFGTPKGFSEDGPFADSTRRLVAYEQGKPDRERLLWQMNTHTGLYVAENRMVLCENFLRSPANWCLMVDSDIEFPKTILETMLETAALVEAKVLVASVPIGETYPSAAFEWVVGEPGVYRSVPVGRRPTRHDAIATAVCLIHREALYAIADREGQKWFIMDIVFPQSAPETPLRDFRYLVVGEDIAFSIRARAAGVALWVYHMPGLKHWKRKAYSHDDAAAAAPAPVVGDGVMVEEITQ